MEIIVVGAETKKLTIGSGDDISILDVYELAEKTLKVGYPLPHATGYAHEIYVFKKK